MRCISSGYASQLNAHAGLIATRRALIRSSMSKYSSPRPSIGTSIRPARNWTKHDEHTVVYVPSFAGSSLLLIQSSVTDFPLSPGRTSRVGQRPPRDSALAHRRYPVLGYPGAVAYTWRVPRSSFGSGSRLFRRRLRQKRIGAELTQAALAAQLGRPQSFVAKYENGERRLDVLEFIEIADAIGFDPGEFVVELKASWRQLLREPSS